EALLFAADRAHHVASLVDPNLDEGNIVITDRYIDSTIAYQAAGRSFDEKTILALSRWATQGLVPHLTIVLDIEPEAAAERMDKRGQSNYLDEKNQQFHQRVRRTYLSRAHKDPTAMSSSTPRSEPMNSPNGSSKPSAAGFRRPWSAVTAPPPREHWQTPVGPP